MTPLWDTVTQAELVTFQCTKLDSCYDIVKISDTNAEFQTLAYNGSHSAWFRGLFLLWYRDWSEYHLTAGWHFLTWQAVLILLKQSVLISQISSASLLTSFSSTGSLFHFSHQVCQKAPFTVCCGLQQLSSTRMVNTRAVCLCHSLQLSNKVLNRHPLPCC